MNNLAFRGGGRTINRNLILKDLNNVLNYTCTKSLDRNNNIYRFVSNIKDLSPTAVYNINDYLDLVPNQVYTVSFEIRTGFTYVTNKDMILVNLGNTDLSQNLAEIQVKGNNNWKYYTFVFKATSDDIDKSKDRELGIRFQTSRLAVRGQGAAGADPDIDWIEVRNLKLERGSKPTPWCPALEDCEVGWIKPNLINGTSGKWSGWITPQYGININNYIYRNILGIPIGKLSYTIELEIKDVDVDFDQEEENILAVNEARYLEDNTSSYGGILYIPWSKNFKNNSVYKSIGTKDTSYVNKKIVSEDIYVRADFWKAGSFRYRMMSLKNENLRNPIWCRSEMDVANPNLIKQIGNNIENKEDGTYTAISITDSPNPFIMEGTKIVRTGSAGNNYGFTYIYTKEQNKEYTASIFVRGKGSFIFWMWGNAAGGFGLENAQIPSETEWTKFTFTFTTQSNNDPDHVHFLVRKDTWCEICGWKIEEGPVATPWVPYNASTLELLPGEEIEINDGPC